MRADEFTTMSTLEEFNLKKAAAAGAMALGALGANAQGIMPGDQPEIRVQHHCQVRRQALSRCGVISPRHHDEYAHRCN